MPAPDTTSLLTLSLGFALGLRHATDADHIVAVSTLVSDAAGAKRGAQHGAKIGAFWGAGHLLTIFLIGSVLVMLRLEIPPRMEWALELMVALVLIGLGVNTLFKCFTGSFHFHQHQHGGRAHAHLHFHAASQPNHEHTSHAPQPAQHFAQPRAPLLLGMAHGLAGTAGLALLVLTSIPTRTLGILYLVVFGLGALVGMAAFGLVLGGAFALPGTHATHRERWLAGLRLLAGTSSGLLGVVLVYRAFLPHAWPF
jgi:ABC-type nickel/cobalt efflux system permease component RcnA